MGVSDILNRTPSSILNGSIGGNVKKLTANLRASASGVLDESRFSSRNELEKAGLDRQYDALQARLARGEIYNTTTSTAGSKLTAKQTALNDIRSIMSNFQGASSNTSASAPTRDELADKTLVQLATVLNRKDSGKYIFGGKTDNVPPITGDITKLDEKNFANVDEGIDLIDISETKSIDANMVTALDIAPFIKALNAYKYSQPGDQIGKSAVDVAIIEATKNHQELQVRVEDALEEVKAAKIDNVAGVSNAKETLASDFTINVVDRAEKMSGAIQSLLINFSIAAGTRNLLEKIMSSS